MGDDEFRIDEEISIQNFKNILLIVMELNENNLTDESILNLLEGISDEIKFL